MAKPLKVTPLDLGAWFGYPDLAVSPWLFLPDLDQNWIKQMIDFVVSIRMQPYDQCLAQLA